MKNFFQSNTYTEILTESNELWVIGDSIENLTSETPRLYVCTPNPGMWGDGTEAVMEMPITNDHGDLQWVNARVVEAEPTDMIGTEAEHAIRTSQRYYFNAGGEINRRIKVAGIDYKIGIEDYSTGRRGTVQLIEDPAKWESYDFEFFGADSGDTDEEILDRIEEWVRDTREQA